MLYRTALRRSLENVARAASWGLQDSRGKIDGNVWGVVAELKLGLIVGGHPSQGFCQRRLAKIVIELDAGAVRVDVGRADRVRPRVAGNAAKFKAAPVKMALQVRGARLASSVQGRVVIRVGGKGSATGQASC